MGGTVEDVRAFIGAHRTDPNSRQHDHDAPARRLV